jgi:hypothetical protein
VSPFVYIVGTLAAVGVVSFVVFEAKASSDAAHLRDTCAPRCAQSDVDAVSASTLAANVSIVAAAVLAASAIGIFLIDAATSRGKPSALP